ncbi:MAG: glycosyltransferase [Verrucomicrobia bacterium]|nr:glycosyltransferase [Verrucomicrobiota bacterium]
MICPKISLVTPSYNQARFIEETLLSVLDQHYPKLEYFVLDGGSSDKTVEILNKYHSRLDFWRSHKDSGQAAAINEGFRRANGEIFGWLNSDDLHLPMTLQTIACGLEQFLTEPVVLYGQCEMFNDRTNSRELRLAMPFQPELLQRTDFLDQPSVFWTRKAWELVGELDTTLNYGFDWDWFLRASRVCRFIKIDALLSRYRIHEGHKSGTGGVRRWREMLKVVSRHSPSDVVRHYEYLIQNGSARWWLNKRMRLEQFVARFAPGLAPSVANLLSPPFWFLPQDLSRDVLWEISGIR